MKKIRNRDKCFVIIFLIVFALFLTTFINKESDYFWHVKAGEYMFNNSLLKKDIFSWSAYNEYWVSHEWLFEVLIYVLRSIFGNISILIYIFISLLMMYFYMYRYNKEKLTSNYFFTLIWICISAFLMPFIQARPHFISFIFVTITIYLIRDFINKKESKKIYILPLLTILWANMHGGSSNLGYLLCFFTFGVSIFKINTSKVVTVSLERKQLYTLLIVGLLSVICTGINIHGFRMTLYPYVNLCDSTMIHTIAEWQPTTVSSISHMPFFVVSTVIFFILLLSKEKIKTIDFALFMLGIYLGLKAIRFWPYIYIFSSFFIFDYVGSFKFQNIFKVMLFTEVALIGIILLSIPETIQVINREYAFLNAESVNIIKENNPKKLYNEYNFGGELIYYDIPVFVDGRADLYSETGILKKYLSIYNMDKDSLQLIDFYDFDMFLVGKDGRVDLYLKDSDKYKVVYDKKSVNYRLYMRN